MASLDVTELHELFKRLCPDLKDIDKTAFEEWLEIALPHVSACRFGYFYYQALVYYVGHLISLAKLINEEGGSSSSIITGPVVSRKEGDLSLSYRGQGSSDSNTNNPLNNTAYGKLFAELRDKVGGGSFMTRFTRMCR